VMEANCLRHQYLASTVMPYERGEPR
jgi:hypothetical protein